MPQPQDHAGSTDDQPRVPWARRSAAALGWVIGFAVAIGLVVAATLIGQFPVGSGHDAAGTLVAGAVTGMAAMLICRRLIRQLEG